MTQWQHSIIATTILMVIWKLFLKKYFITQKDVSRWQEIFTKFFFD